MTDETKKAAIRLGNWAKLRIGEDYGGQYIEVWEINTTQVGGGLFRIGLLKETKVWKVWQIGDVTVTPDDMRHAGIIMGRQQVREVVDASTEAFKAGVDAFRKGLERVLSDNGFREEPKVPMPQDMYDSMTKEHKSRETRS